MKSDNDESSDMQKKSKIHNRQRKTRPIPVCEDLTVIFKMAF